MSFLPPSTGKPAIRRVWFPGVVLVLAAAGTVGAFAAESTLRYAIFYLAIVGSALSIGIWWVFFAGRFRWKSLIAGGAALSVFGIAAKLTLRFDGAADGADPLHFTWKWTPESDETLEAFPEKHEIELSEVAGSSDPDLADFPAFLGAGMDGTAPNPGLKTDWEANPPEELWRIRVGVGWSAFSVVGELAVTQEQRGDEELVTCYRVKDGQFLWSHSDPVRFREPMGGDGPRATPTIRDGVVYALGATGILNALRLEDGSGLWTRSVLEEAGSENIEWGKSGSPLIAGQLVIVTGGKSEDNAVIAYRRDTGELAWKSGDGPASYSSPVRLTVAGKEQIVAVLGDNVTGLEPETGKVLWRFDWPGSFPKVAQPIQVGPDQLLVASSYGVPTHLLKLTSGESWQAESVWAARQMKTKFSSPVVKDGYAYGLDEGKLICMEVATGERVWKGAKYGYGQNLLVGADILLIQAENGDVALVRISPNGFTELARISPLSGKTWNAPALAGKYLIVRNDREAVGMKLP